MQTFEWKSVNNYCVATLRTTGFKKSDGIIKIALLKVKNGEIVDKYFSNVKPKLRFKKQKEEYKDFDIYRPFEEIIPEIVNFIGKDTIIGFYNNFDYEAIYNNSGTELENRFVDVFIPYKKSFKNFYGEYFDCTLENIYKTEYGNKSKPYDFTDPYDRCLAIQELYESRKKFNKYIADLRKNTHEMNKSL